MNANRQLSGETERSRAEFLRGQRQTAYSKFLADRWTLWRSEEELFTSFGLPPDDNSYVVEPTTKEHISIAGQAATDKLLQFTADQMTIEVIRSPRVRQASEVLNLQYGGILLELTKDKSDAFKGGPINSRAMADRYHQLVRDTIPALSRFIRAARADMGAQVGDTSN